MKENPAAKDGLVQKLQALQNMTVANGCTESEALVAAGKAAVSISSGTLNDHP